MDETPRHDPFGFLTDQRAENFRRAIASANRWHQNSLSTGLHVYEHFSHRGKASNTREWFIGHLMEVFSVDSGAKRREINNISGLEFDNKHFLYLKKLLDPTEPPLEPKTVSRARSKAELPRQSTYLIDIEVDEVESSQTDLCDLYPILGGYVRTEGEITAFYFIDRDEDEVYDYRQLDLSTTSIYAQREVIEPPKTILKLRSDSKKKDSIDGTDG